MKSKNAIFFSVFLFLGFLAAGSAFGADGQASTQSAMPKWLEVVLGALGVAGTGGLAIILKKFGDIKKKVEKGIELITDLRAIIDQSIRFFYAAKKEMAQSSLLPDFNSTIELMAEFLDDTGIDSLEKKAMALRACRIDQATDVPVNKDAPPPAPIPAVRNGVAA
jgi:hypothetical protein